MAGASRIKITALAASAPGSSVRAVAGAEAAECHAADGEWALADVGEGDDQVRRDTEFDLAEVGRAAERQDSRRCESGHRDGAGTARIVAVDGDGRRLAAEVTGAKRSGIWVVVSGAILIGSVSTSGTMNSGDDEVIEVIVNWHCPPLLTVSCFVTHLADADMSE